MVIISTNDMEMIINYMGYFLERSSSKDPEDCMAFVKNVVDCRLFLDALKMKETRNVTGEKFRKRRKLYPIQGYKGGNQHILQSSPVQGCEDSGEDVGF
jgi:hypothetical protein